ncbi:Hypothetical protein CINCED_3A005406 [Cinara cedri]|uniref:Uncharacterized protein n=1 Tax=Cinara cedri TaxID=506608 RepID=A0A5E4NL69_9HEMI|nr:Hypothetical protein CINCED_3A005406 [Cinara cedri]
MVRVITILLVIISGILCSGAQQGVSSTQAGQTLQIQPNVRKYNKHTATESSTSGTRKDKPGDNSDAQDYVPIGGPAPGTGYPYPYPAYPYPYQPVAPVPGSLVLVPSGGPYRPAPQYPYEPQYPVDGAQPPAPYYPPYYPATPSPPPPYPALPYPPPPPPPAYPAPQTLYEQATVIEAYRSPQLPPYLQQQPTGEQSQFFRQPVTAGQYYYGSPQQSGPPPPHFRAHAHNRPMPTAAPPAFLQQRDASPTATSVPATAAAANNNAEPQYEQQQSGPFDGNQFHY